MGMSQKRRALGRGLGALIPTAPSDNGSSSPMDVFFKDNSSSPVDPSPPVSRETSIEDPAQSSGTGADSFSPDLAPVPGARFAELSVLSIRPNPRQPRQAFGDEDM